MKKLFTLSIFLFLLSTVVPPSAGAACYCQDPSVCRCSTTKTTPFSTTLNYNKAGAGKFQISTSLKIYCDTPEEVNSLDAVRAPVCGSSPEVISTCARGPGPSEAYWTCWGSSVASGTMSTNLNPLPGPKGIKDYSFSGGFTFNGIARNAQGSVRICADNVNCCGNINNCFAGDIPGTPTSCPDQNPSITPPADICGAVPGKDSQGSGESRLWFPHLRNISALSTLLQTMFNPFPSLFGKNAEPPAPQSAALDNSAAVTTRITLHQGKDDDTPIVNQSDNNSSLREGQPAPTPLYNFGGSGPYNQSGLCTISDAKSNPGDDLLGPKITTRLTYTQKFTYKTAPRPIGCRPDNSIITGDDRDKKGVKCCSEFSGSGGYSALPPSRISDPQANRGGQNLTLYRCATRPGQDFPTQGRAVVYTKTPLVEYIYNTLVIGPQSILKRLFPQGNPKEFKEISAKAEYVADATGVNQDDLPVNLKAGDGSTQPTIYFPHLGSLYEYFLVGLQKALRPLTSLVPPVSSQPVPDNSPQRTCVYDEGQLQAAAVAAANQYRVSKAALLAISKIEGSNKYVPGQAYTCAANSSGAVGPMQITNYTYLESGPNFISSEERLPLNYFACDDQGSKLNRCNIYDAMTMSARLLRLKMAIPPGTGIGDVTTCKNIYHATCKYYGGVCTDGLTRAWNSNSQVANPPAWPMSYADIVFALGEQYYGLNCSYQQPNCSLYGCK